MDILICQSCGAILRGKSKFCTGCGTTVSKFSPTPLRVIGQATAPLATTPEVDPMLVERAFGRLQYAGAGVGVAGSFGSYANDHAGIAQMASAPLSSNGGNDHYSNGGGDGSSNGHEGNAGHAASVQTNDFATQQATAESGAGLPPMASDPTGDAAAIAAGVAAAVSTSRLQNILGSAAAKSAQNPMASSTFVSLETDQEAAVRTQAEQPPSVIPAPSDAPIAAASSPNNSNDFTPAASNDFAATPSDTGFSAAAAQSNPIASTIGGAPQAMTAAPAVGSASMEDSLIPPLAAHVPPTAPTPPSDFFSAQTEPVSEVQSLPAPPDAPPPIVTADNGGATFFPPTAPAAQLPPSEVPSENSTAEGGVNLIMPPGGVSTNDDWKAASNSLISDEPEPMIGPPPLPTTNIIQKTNEGQEAVVDKDEPVAAASFFTQPQPADSSTFDFFAQSTSPRQVAPAPAPVTAKPEPVEPPAPTSSIDIPEGLPSIVADAIRAAQSQQSIPVVEAEPEDARKPKLIVEDDFFTDEQVKRRKQVDEPTEDQKKEKPTLESRFADDSSDEKPTGGFTVGGITISIKHAAIAFGSIIALMIFMSMVTSMLGSGSKQAANGGLAATTSGNPYFGGLWKFGIQGSSGKTTGQMRINIQNGNFTGMGVDQYGSFVIQNGTVHYPNIQFHKQYVVNGNQPAPNSKPILFGGTIDWVNPHPGSGNIGVYTHVSGMWTLQKRDGFGWRAQIVTRQGKWEAELVEPTPGGTLNAGPSFFADANPNSNTPSNPIFALFKWVFAIPSSANAPPAEMANFFLHVAVCGIGFVLCIVFMMGRLFGPSGLINIWSKKEYIPSQFKAQHFKILREFGKPAKPGGMPLGKRADWNLMKVMQPRELSVPPDVRVQNPHMLVLGAGSKGKSRLLAGMIAHDIEANDRAVVVVDSDGGLIDILMHWIAAHPKGKEIAKRLTIIDPSHGGESLAYNPLEFPDDGDLQNAASAVVFGFKAIYTEPPGSQSQWNQQTANILRNAAILLMANGKTLTDLPILLSENDFRDVLLEKIERQKAEKAEFTTLLEAWSQYKRLARTDQWINWVEPILNRVQPMLGDPRIRPILTKAKGDLNLKELINEGRILFVKVPQGQLDQNANLLGSLIVTGLKQAALSLSLKASARKRTCALYLDEFDNFIEKETFDAITSETKKFQIGFVGASKTLQGLPDDYRNQIIINVGTLCAFALAKKDGDILGPQMFRVDGRKVKNQTLQNIFNRVNTSPQFELISDEEKLNIDRVVGQDERHFFCYRVGTVAGVFQMKSHDFEDIPDKDINWTLIDQIYGRSLPSD